MKTSPEGSRGHERAESASKVPAEEGLASADAGELRDRTRQDTVDAEWLSMATGDPALYIKDAE